MSLFYTSRQLRMINTRKRKKASTEKDQETQSCDWCRDEYDSETDLHVHKRVKHRFEVATLLKEETSCKICLTKHDYKGQLIKHIKTIHLLSSEDAEHVHREIFICDICHQFYFNKDMLSIHMQYSHDPEHKDKLTGKCPKCFKNIRIRHVWFHFQRHLIQSVSSCPICLTKCKNQKDLIEHTKLHPCYYHCSICMFKSRVKESFTQHMQLHNSNLHLSGNIAIDEALPVKCFVPRKLPKKHDFNFGIRGLRLMELHICVLCRGICTEEEKASHIAQYHLVDIVTIKKQYMCVCGEGFFNNILLKHHVFKLKGEHKACDTE